MRSSRKGNYCFAVRSRAEIARERNLFYVNKNGDAIFISYKRRNPDLLVQGPKGPYKWGFLHCGGSEFRLRDWSSRGEPSSSRKIPDMEDENKYERRIMV